MKTSSPTSHADEPQRWVGRQSSKRSRRDAILHTVATLLRESRMSTLTMDDIAESLGITKGNLYYYFRDKQDILYQCHMRSMALSLDALARIQDQQDSLTDPLHQLLIAHIEGIASSPFGGALLADLDSMHVNQRRFYIARRDAFEEGVRALIRLGIARGLYRETDPKIASLSLLGAINWLPRWYHPDGPLDPAGIARSMADLLMRTLWINPPN